MLEVGQIEYLGFLAVGNLDSSRNLPAGPAATGRLGSVDCLGSGFRRGRRRDSIMFCSGHITSLLATHTEKSYRPQTTEFATEFHAPHKLLMHNDMHDGIDEIVVPSETLKKNNRLGQKITVDKLIFPGYAFVRARLQGLDGSMNTVVYDRVLAVYGVRDFVGSIRNTAEGQATTVSPMTEQEITDIKDYMAKNQEDGGRIENAFKEGDAIRVTAGSFMGLEGCVIRVENEQGKATAVLQVFGRETSVELKTADLEPVTS